MDWVSGGADPGVAGRVGDLQVPGEGIVGSAQRVVQSALSILKQLKRKGGDKRSSGEGSSSVSEATSEADSDEGEVEELDAPAPPAPSAAGDSGDFRDLWTSQMAKDGLVGALVALAYPDRIAM